MCLIKTMRLKGHKTIVSLSLAGLVLAGCSSDYVNRNDKISLDVGDAVARNKIAQIIDPWPHHAERTTIHTDSKRMIVAIDKYDNGPKEEASSSSSPVATAN